MALFAANSMQVQAQSIQGEIQGDPPFNPSRTGPVLYDQISNPAGGYYVSQEFTDAANLTKSSQSADDFIVPAGETWNIGSIHVTGYYWPGGAGGATALNVYILSDDNGMPGLELQAYEGITNFTVEETTVNGNQIHTYFEVPFSIPITLTSGHYWLSFQVVGDYGVIGQWGWESQANNPWLNEQVYWRNPGNGFGYGYTTWTPGTTAFMFGYMDQSFALYEVPFNDDLSAKALVSPENSSTLGSAEIITMQFKNEGSDAQTGFNVSYSINNGTPVVENVGSLLVDPEEIVDYSFTTTANLSQPGIYNVVLSTELAGDQFTSNDAVEAQVVNYGTVYTMQDGVNITACSGTFVDPGGINANFDQDDMATVTIYPETSGYKSRLTFVMFDVTWSDFMIYDGESTDAPLIGSWNKGTEPPGVITALNMTGALTIYFEAPGWDNAPGWEAVISCYETPQNDFAILDFSRSEYTVFSGRDITYTATLRNLGLLAQSKTVTFKLDGNTIGTVNTPVVNPTEYATVEMVASIDDIGSHTMEVSIPDDDGDDPSNNSADMNFDVYTFGDLVEFFEGNEFPPDFWRTNNWYHQTEADFAYSGTGSAQSYVGNFEYDTLFTPQLSISVGDSISFEMMNSLWWPGFCEVGWVDGTTGVYTTIENIVPGIYYERYYVDISAAAGNNYIAFINYMDDWMYWGGELHIDDVVGMGPQMYFVDYDMTAYNLQGTVTPIVNEPESFQVTVRNIGALDVSAGNYSVKLMQVVEGGDDIVLQSLNGQAIDHLEEITYTFNYTFEASGEYDIYARVDFTPDMKPDNNQTVLQHLYVQVAGTVEEPAGNGNMWDYWMPVCTYTPYSLCEMIYPDTMISQTGVITGITYFYKNENYEDVNDIPVYVYVGTTDQNDLTGSWIPSTEMVEVVTSDTLDFLMGSHEVYIPFDVPYNYQGGNLAVMVMKDSTGYVPVVQFRQTVMQDTMAMWSNQWSPRPDPANPDSTVYGTPVEYITDAVFFINTVGLGELGGTVYDEDGIPFQGVTVSVDGYNISGVTDANGQYFFNEVLGGNQSVTAEIFEYEDNTQPVFIQAGFYNNLDFTMVPKPIVTVSGTVVGSDDPMHFIEDAKVRLTGYFTHISNTDENGEFAIPSVYGNETYTMTVTKQGFETYVSTVVVGDSDVDVGTIVLTELHTIPFYVHGEEGYGQVDVTWNAPNTGTDEAYDYNVNINQGYTNEPYENVWLGNIYQTDDHGTITSVDLHFADYPAPGTNEYVTLDILNKDAEVLVTSDPFIPPLNAWINIDVPNIAFDEDFYVMVHWQDNEQSTCFLGIELYTPQDLAYIMYPGADPYLLSNVVGYPGIFDMVVNVTLETDTSSSRATRWIESYNIYKGLYAEISQAPTWEPLNSAPITGTSYVDEDWPPQVPDHYVYAIEAIFTTGESELSFSNPVFNLPPEFISEPVTYVLATTQYIYDVETDDPNSDMLVITADTLPEWLTLEDHGDGTATLSGTPMDLGFYDVVLRVTDGSLDATQEFTIHAGAVGVDELDVASVVIYPNPFSSYLTIEWKGMKEASIYNSVGSQVGYYRNIKDVTTINLENLPAGVYLVRFTNGESEITKKIIKN